MPRIADEGILYISRGDSTESISFIVKDIITDSEEIDLPSCIMCGDPFTDDNPLAHTDDNGSTCSECCTECDACGETVPRDTLSEVIGGELVCESCRDNHYTECTHCGRLENNDDIISDNNDYYYLCDRCYNRNYTRCCNCDDIISQDDSYYSERNDMTYCEGCYPGDGCGDVLGHDDDPDEFIFYMTPEQSKMHSSIRHLFEGFEIEVDGEDGDSQAIHWIRHESPYSEKVYLKSDGSLDYGFEIVSHPMTLAYHRDYAAWDKLLSKVSSYGWRSHGTSTCGLHVHVSKNFFTDSDLAEMKMIYIFEKFWKYIVAFSRRSEGRIAEWAKRYGIDTNNSIVDEYKSKIKDGRYYKSNISRYSAINLMNYNTIEFRVFRGTLKYESLIATLEFVDLICRLGESKTITEIYCLTWDGIVSIAQTDYKYLYDYLVIRGISSSKQSYEGQ